MYTSTSRVSKVKIENPWDQVKIRKNPTTVPYSEFPSHRAQLTRHSKISTISHENFSH